MQIKDIESYGKVATLSWALAVFIAEALTASEKATKVSHFALYLMGQSWVEVSTLLLCYALFKYLKWITPRIRLTMSSARTRSKVALWLFLIGSSLLLLTCGFGLYLLLGNRYEFWTAVAPKAYVQRYVSRIDTLAQGGRMTDSYQLAQEVAQNLNGKAEAHYLDRRIQVLKGVCTRSEQLTRLTSGVAWNPVTQRDAYFQVAEAVRLNPQNYEAADRSRKMVETLTEYLRADAQSACKTTGNVMAFRGNAISGLEAYLRWSESGSDCSAIESHLIQAWNIDAMTSNLQLSDETRVQINSWQQKLRSRLR